MKAALIERCGALTVADIAVPEVGEYDALCSVLYGATCAGTDMHVINNQHRSPIHYPTVLGHESIGRVIEVGKKARNYSVGDLVTRVGCPAFEEKGYFSNWGGFAEYGIAKDHQAMKEDGIARAHWQKSRVNLVLPPEADPAASTMIITWRETLSFTKRLGVKAGARLLILGSGSNALAFAAHAYLIGVKSITVIGSKKRADSFTVPFAVNFIDYKDLDYLKWASECEPDGFDIIIDAIGKNGMLNSVLPLVKSGGTISVYGWDDYYTNKIAPLTAKDSFFVYNGGYDENEVHDEVVRLFMNKKLDSSLWMDMDNPYPLEQIGQAYEELRVRKAMKILIQIQGD